MSVHVTSKVNEHQHNIVIDEDCIVRLIDKRVSEEINKLRKEIENAHRE